jgi:hypothetical protein
VTNPDITLNAQRPFQLTTTPKRPTYTQYSDWYVQGNVLYDSPGIVRVLETSPLPDGRRIVVKAHPLPALQGPLRVVVSVWDDMGGAGGRLGVGVVGMWACLTVLTPFALLCARALRRCTLQYSRFVLLALPSECVP